MNTPAPIGSFAPLFQPDQFSQEDRDLLNPFFTNLSESVYAPVIPAPELIGALCSRTSRAPEDLRMIFLKEYISPFIHPVREEKDSDQLWKEKNAYGESLREFVAFLQKHPLSELFSNPRARSFYTKWLAQYGDDSIAQMAGTHLVYSGISQVAIKHFEDQRIGLAPIEKSTRYVNYSKKTNGHYLYYTDPVLKDLGFANEYERVMDNLFETYTRLIPKLTDWLSKKFPEEKPAVVEKKAFDTLRGLLPTSTLSQVAFFGNGQAFEYLVSRSLQHPLGEIRWAGNRALEELNKVTPSFFKRIQDHERVDIVRGYQEYLAHKSDRVAPFVDSLFSEYDSSKHRPAEPGVRLVEFDPEGELKIIAGVLFSAPNNRWTWEENLERVKEMDSDKKKNILAEYLHGRTERWQKVGRAFENTYVRFEITMNIGAWRDLHRHRMLTQQRQLFTTAHGYDVPREVVNSGFDQEFKDALDPVSNLYERIAVRDPYLAQYACALAHRIRFMQWENLRQSFWQIELRSIPEGHPDYRRVVQEKFRLLSQAYPLIAEYFLVNVGEYDFARRGQEEKIQQKLKLLDNER